MRYSLRRALSLDSVDGGTHNPTIGDLQSTAFQERETDSFGKKKACREQTAKPKFLDLTRREPRGFLSCSARARRLLSWFLKTPHLVEHVAATAGDGRVLLFFWE